MISCGVPEYINALPFVGPYRLGALTSKFQFVMAAPRDLNALVEANKLPLSFVSSIYYLEHKEKLELVSGLGIGAKYQVQSVRLYYPEALKSLDGVTVALDPESATSNRVAKWLLTKVKKYTPNFVVPKNVVEGPLHTAFLLIGDRCLAFGCPKGYKAFDLGEEWMNVTGNPLPFCVVVAQKGWAKENREKIGELKDDLLNGLSWSFDHKKELFALSRRQSTLSEERVLSYWDHLAYVFDYRYQLSLDYMEKQV